MERKKKAAAASELKKAGPRDMGKIKYKGTKIDYQDDGDLLADRTSSFVKRKSGDIDSPPIKKLGPRDMGKIKYKGTKLDENGKPIVRSKKKGKHKSNASSSSSASSSYYSQSGDDI